MNNISYLIKYQCFNISKKKWPRVYKTSVYFNSFDLCYTIIIDKRNVYWFFDIENQIQISELYKECLQCVKNKCYQFPGNQLTIIVDITYYFIGY